ncbi:WD domain, G-beta repeat family protein [Lysobacter antibioticus]|uniref:toll/interleukin-1 receptor domain-containing protein n=1 Tax=Lysobacter antibioticus TaxID=84531 RepID=UPI0007171919|nr:toll/interleukin-1 receptor domain-containing protein [Lysobacter antibioticus]ALN61909.1 WD domain, G-beta repeat family protein [Lysobacter antibioticus]
MSYKAFISYSHAADGKLAPAVQRALHRVAKPWYRLRTMRVFRDQTNLAASPRLWTSIESALKETEFFLYMASPTAAQSPWVQKEVDWWLKNRSPERFLILLTEGDIAWSEVKQDLDWTATTALPQQMAGALAEEPLYTDLRWARTENQLSSRHSRFRTAILELTATLLNRPKDELDGDDVRQYRRTKRLAWAAVTVLVGLLIAAILAAYFATQQSRLATSRALGVQSQAVLPTNPELSLLLAREALRFKEDSQAKYSLQQALVKNPLRTIHIASERPVLAKFFGGPDLLAVAEPGQRVSLWDAATAKRLSELSAEVLDELMLSHSAKASLVVLQAKGASFALHDSKTGRVLAELPGSSARVGGDGRVITATQGTRIRQWSTAPLRERNSMVSLPAGYELRDVSADGGLLFLAEEGGTEVSPGVIVHAQSGEALATLPERVLRHGDRFSPNGRLLVTEPMDDSNIELRDARTGRVLRTLEGFDGDDIGWTTTIKFSPDGKLLAAGNRSGDLHMWKVDTGELVASATHGNRVKEIEISPDSQMLLSVSWDGTACLWDLDSVRCIAVLGGKGDEVWDIGFSPDSKRFLTTHSDGTVRVWHRETWYPQLLFPAERAALSDDGRFALSGGLQVKSGTDERTPLRLWDAERGKPLAWLEGSVDDVESMAVNSPGSLVAVAWAQRAVRLWNARTGKPAAQLGAASASSTALAFSMDGSQLATGSEDGKVRFWRTADGSLLGGWQTRHDRVTGLSLHPDGERVVVGTMDGSVQVRHMPSGNVLMEVKLREEYPAIVAFSPDGNLLLAGSANLAQVWDVNKGIRVQTFAHPDDVWSGAFSSDGRMVVIGSGYFRASGDPPEDGNAVHVWDLQSGRLLLSYRSPGRHVTAVTFAKDDVIVAASGDGTVRRYACEICAPLPALIGFASSRTARSLSAQERAQFVPESVLGSWLNNLAALGNSPQR